MRNLDYSKLKKNIQVWIIDYIRSAKSDGVVVGLSGGIDSSVTTALCVNALGKEKVICLSLPCESPNEDIEDAFLIADKMDVDLTKIDLTSTYNKYVEILEKKIEPNKLALANLKPRLRMAMLYAVGQSKGNYLIAGTGNKTEICIGYFTKYGDGGVDFEPIGDLYKCEVKNLAIELEIPEKIINKPPSAGLWKGQTDEDEIGLSYDVMDEILYHLDNNMDLDEYKKQDIQKMRKMIKTSKHKRRMPPVYKIQNK